MERIIKDGAGKLIITSNFGHVSPHEPFKIPVLICKSKILNTEAPKIIKIITLNDN